MNCATVCSFLSCILVVCGAQSRGAAEQGGYVQGIQYYKDPPLKKYPPPRILAFRQAQSHDGAFKFEYTAEHGLAHSEVVAPDGTRNGGYTYVDPHGKTITVKYSAGKDGFRILEGDHIPRDSASHQAVYNQAFTRPNYDPNDDGSYKPEKYEHPYQAPEDREAAREQSAPVQYKGPVFQQQQQSKSYQPQTFYRPQQQSQPQPQHQLQIQYVPVQKAYQRPQYYQPQVPLPQYQTNEVEERNDVGPRYPHVQPGKAHSFGTGYSFQFSGK